MKYFEKKTFDKSLVDFIVRENYNHHQPNIEIKNLKAEVDDIYSNEIIYEGSKTFISIDENKNVVGTIRVIEWNYRDILPIQKIFNIDPKNFISKDFYRVFHIGRFAIKRCKNNSLKTFKTLMLLAIGEVCKKEKSFAFAECDSKLLMVLNRLGIEAKILSDAIDYLGSETIPVLLSYDSLKKFQESNDHFLKELP